MSFELHDVNSGKDKDFEPIRQTETVHIDNPDDEETIEIKWHKQENSSDCGPCMLLNILSVKRPSKNLEDIDVRSEVNQIRENRGEETLDTEDWLSSTDVRNFLESHGFEVNEHKIPPEQHPDRGSAQRRCQEAIEDQNYDLIYLTTGRHFRAITKNGLLLDSFQDCPRWLSDQEVEDMISEALNHEHERLWERVGLVCEQGIEFNPHL